jgi:DMSO/TMAO reductase YedYZ molybdopterin-dependent catalytic subunit
MKNKYLTLTLTAAILGILIATPIGSAGITESAPNLEITNLSGTSYIFTFTQILAMPKTIVNSDLYCDGALVTYGDWGGVLLSYLLTQAHANASEVGSVRFEASDGYQVTIPIKLAMDPKIIVAYELNDQPLEEGLRLIIPDANGAAWIAKITFITVSTSGADYPLAVGVSPVASAKANSTAPNQNTTTQPSSTKQPTPIQTQPPTQNNSSSIQKATPTNATQPAEPTENPVESNSNLNLNTILLIGFICAILLSTVVYISFGRRRKQLQ